jgi:hypothetical protein
MPLDRHELLWSVDLQAGSDRDGVLPTVVVSHGDAIDRLRRLIQR